MENIVAAIRRAVHDFRHASSQDNNAAIIAAVPQQLAPRTTVRRQSRGGCAHAGMHASAARPPARAAAAAAARAAGAAVLFLYTPCFQPLPCAANVNQRLRSMRSPAPISPARGHAVQWVNINGGVDNNDTPQKTTGHVYAHGPASTLSTLTACKAACEKGQKICAGVNWLPDGGGYGSVNRCQIQTTKGPTQAEVEKAIGSSLGDWWDDTDPTLPVKGA